MRYYAHYGHRDFILCLGYRGDLIRQFFLTYNECMSNDFTLSDGGKRIELASSDIHDWRITFVDTGMHSNIGDRLSRVRRYVEGEDMFLANYSDGLTDLPLDSYVEAFRSSTAVAGFAAVRPRQSFHSVQVGSEGVVTGIQSMSASDYWINGGFFCLRKEIFDHLRDGEELVDEPFQRLIREGRLWAHKYEGFWAAMDTFKDKIAFDRMESQGDCPWMQWKRS